MIVHFIGSRSHIAEEVKYYRRIVDCIKGEGHTVPHDWIEEMYVLSQQGKLKKDDQSWSEVDQDHASAIAQADVIIVEATSRGFFEGYEASQAAYQKKPMLILTRDTSAVGISGLTTPTGFVKSVTYEAENLEEIVREFLAENIIDTKDLRFNFFLDRKTYTYLRWVSSKTGKTKAQIVRSLLQKEMNKDDEITN
jgi:hypothetical protein